MRGKKQEQVSVACLLNYVEAMIPQDHPIRTIKRMLWEVLGQMDEHFDEMYAELGRRSIPPEQLLLAGTLTLMPAAHAETAHKTSDQYVDDSAR